MSWSRDNDRRRYERRKALGLCLLCGREPAPGSARCAKCRAIPRLQQRRRRDQGLCITCGKCEPEPERSRCRRCLDRAAEQARRKRARDRAARESVPLTTDPRRADRDAIAADLAAFLAAGRKVTKVRKGVSGIDYGAVDRETHRRRVKRRGTAILESDRARKANGG